MWKLLVIMACGLLLPGPAAAVTAFGTWLGGPGIWSNPLRWGIACADIPPPLTPSNSATCLFTVNITGSGSEVTGDVPATISVLNLTAGGELAVNFGLTSLVSTSIGSGSGLSIGPAATYNTGILLNDGTVELELLSGMAAASVLNNDRFESTGGTLTTAAFTNSSGAVFEVLPGLSTLATALVENEGLFDLTTPGASLTGGLGTLEFIGGGEADLGGDSVTLTALGSLGNLGSHTLRGSGSVVSATMVNEGDILADDAGETLSVVTGVFDNDGDLRAPGGTLDIDAVSMTHDGTLESTTATGKWEVDASDLDNDGLMVARQAARGEVKNAAVDNIGGILSGDGGSIAFENVDIEGGLLTSNGTGFLTMAGVGSLADLTTDADLRLLAGSTSFLEGTIVNDDRMTLADTAGAPGSGPSVILDGIGTIELTGDAAILGSTTQPWTQKANHTIEGYGTFQGQAITNQNLIRANVSGETLRLFAQNTLVNEGVLQATGGGVLKIDQSDVDNDGGSIDAATSSTIEVVTSTVRGGALIGGGELTWAGGSALLNGTSGPITGDVNQRVLGGAILTLDDLINSKTVVLDEGAVVQALSSKVVQYTGIGDFLLEGPAAAFGVAGSSQYVQGADHMLHGEGQVRGFGFQNQGNVLADQGGKILDLRLSNGVPGPELTNTGLLGATNGGTLHVEDTDIDNESGMIDAAAGSLVELVNSQVRGGFLTGAGDVTWAGIGNTLMDGPSGGPTTTSVNQRLLGGGQLVFEDLVNHATFTVEDGATVLPNGAAIIELSGTGEIVLDGPTATFGLGGSSQPTNQADHTIRGEGQIRGFSMYNLGTVLADQSGKTLDMRLSNSVPAPDVQNDGLIAAANGGLLYIEDTDIDNRLGTIRADTGSVIEVANGTFRGGLLTGGGEFQWGTTGLLGDVDGATTTTDALHRITGSLVRMAGPVQNDGRIVVEAGGLFSPNTNSAVVSRLDGTGSLELRDATSEVGGIVSGFWQNGAGHRLEGVGTVKAAGFTNHGILAAGLRNPGLEAGVLSLVVIQTDLTASSVLEIQLGGTDQGVDYDFISASRVDLGGILDVSFLDGFEDDVLFTDVFTVMTGEVTLEEAFANVMNGSRVLGSDGLGSFRVHYGAGSLFDPKSVVLSEYEAVPEPGTAVMLLVGLLGLARPDRRFRRG